MACMIFLKNTLVQFCIVFLVICPAVFAETIAVDIYDPLCVSSSNQSNPYSIVYCNIQSAIDDATTSDTIIVADGIYRGEGNRNIVDVRR